MCPWPSSSTCSAASPCARLSRAPSTTSGSDFHDSVGLPMDGPFSRPTRLADRREIYGPPAPAAITDVAHVPAESPRPDDLLDRGGRDARKGFSSQGGPLRSRLTVDNGSSCSHSQ